MDAVPPWLVMWAIAVTIFVGCKALTMLGSDAPIPRGRGMIYAIAWPGLDADAFCDSTRKPVAPGMAEVVWAIGKIVIGMALVAVAATFIERSPLGFGWVGMVGTILVLHFGTFQLLSCFWRKRGIDAKPLMREPLMARSVGEFWGQRWNTAFRDLTHKFLFAPLTKRLGPRRAIVVGFFLSGLVHELVITVPARGGYGLPTIYFTWQGVAMLIERAKPLRGPLRQWRGRLWTIAAVALPAPILFPPVFVERVIAPMLRAISIN